MTTTFEDCQGTAWRLCLNATLVKDVRDALMIDLVSLDKDPFARLEADPVLLVDVLFMLCEKEAKERGIASREFGERISPEALGKAVECLQEAIISFFPPGKQCVVRSAFEANRASLRDAEAELIADMTSERTRQAVRQANKREISRAIGGLLSSTERTGTPNSEALKSVT